MNYLIALSATAVAPLLAIPALAQSGFPPAISVTGEASVSAPPDLAQLHAGVASVGKTAREAAEANNGAMAKVIAALKGAGIEDKDFQTSRLSLQPQYAGASPIKGYRASNLLTVKLHDVGKAPSVIDALVGAGANDVGNVSFTVSQPSKLLDEAREKALADARRKAEIYASSAGVTLGVPLAIVEDGAAAAVLRAKTPAAVPMAAATPVAQGEETLSVTVSVSYSIKAAEK